MAALTGHLLVAPFPAPGRQLRNAYRQLETAQFGTQQQRKALGDPARLPRPWVPETLSPAQRRELWDWLEQVVPWLNEHYTWATDALMPACWPKHPHLVLELITVADQRYRAGLALTGGPLEEWHRYCLPAFTDRWRARHKDTCSEGHQGWPGRTRQGSHQDQSKDRERRYAADTEASKRQHGQDDDPEDWPAYAVDPETGEVLDE